MEAFEIFSEKLFDDDFLQKVEDQYMLFFDQLEEPEGDLWRGLLTRSQNALRYIVVSDVLAPHIGVLYSEDRLNVVSSDQLVSMDAVVVMLLTATSQTLLANNHLTKVFGEVQIDVDEETEKLVFAARQAVKLLSKESSGEECQEVRSELIKALEAFGGI